MTQFKLVNSTVPNLEKIQVLSFTRPKKLPPHHVGLSNRITIRLIFLGCTVFTLGFFDTGLVSKTHEVAMSKYGLKSVEYHFVFYIFTVLAFAMPYL